LKPKSEKATFNKTTWIEKSFKKKFPELSEEFEAK
jgi:hypothetical protein